ncbi:RNase H domain-containing protein [Ceratobasidium theobromae]|uniref:RNase H domain-containing protein n=1 Tax=Ceratobasidium theobromae TaxID=1582974 RepID=A0A5N5Q707_9AGAM|nr:RNase H domain-containing protein [Ceratobasidium theobromae]
MACHWATRSFRTAPTAILEHVIALPPIHFRLWKLCVNYTSKLRHIPANSQVNARLPPAFDSHCPDVAYPAPLSPINAIAAYTHPQAEFHTPYLMLPWEGIRHLPDRVSLITRKGRSDKSKKAYIRAIKDCIAIQDSNPKAVVLFTDGSSIVKNRVHHNSWGWVSFKLGCELANGGSSLGPRSTIYNTEAWALLIGLRNLLPFVSRSGATRIAMFSDNTGLIQALLL